MDTQKNVLLVTNAVTGEEVAQIKQAVEDANAKNNGLRIKLNLVHVIPNLPTCYFNIPSMVNLAEQYYEEAKKCLTTIGDKLDVAKKNQWLITGRIKNEVLRLAGKLNTDYILASSTNIQDLYKSISLKKELRTTDVRSVNNIGKLVTQLNPE